jgi:hypothetical protein
MNGNGTLAVTTGPAMAAPAVSRSRDPSSSGVFIDLMVTSWALSGLVYKYWTKGHLSGAIAP